jgi:adenosylcobinamide-GDP ribazoletransferase
MVLGTLTVLRVPAPARVDRAVAGRAMALAPLAGLLLAVPAVALIALGHWRDAPPLLVATIAVAVVALGSRGLHLDGLADTADGLAAAYGGLPGPPGEASRAGLAGRERALAVMRRGDTGPAGVATLVLVLLIQVAALAATVDRPWATLVAVVAGRSVLSMACARGVPSARDGGLGATVAGTVPVLAAIGVLVATAGAAAAIATPWWTGALAVASAYAVAGLLLWRCVRRLGGITGDVLGACVEVAVAAALVAAALAQVR